MPFVAEFKTHGRSKMLDFGHAPDEDKDAIEKFEKQAIAMAKTRRRPVYLTMVASCIPGSMVNADTGEFYGGRLKRLVTEKG